MMKTEFIKNIFLSNFYFLEEIGYCKIAEYTGEKYKYKFGISFENKLINQKLNLGYYDKNPIDKKDNSYAFLLKLFKDNSHIDFSRLLKNNIVLSKFCKFQYFIVNQEIAPEYFLSVLSEVVKNECANILNGKEWIEIKYDLRDDYI